MVKLRRRTAVLGSLAMAISASVGWAVNTMESPPAPEAAWHAVGDAVGSLDDFACATPTWCVGLEAFGGQNQATTWNGHGWTAPVSIPPYEDYVALSCPSAGSCVGLTANGLTFRLADGAWRIGGRYDSAVAGPAYASPGASLSCSATDACVAVNAAGDEVTLGPNGWMRPVAIDGEPLTGLACPAPGSCVATDGDGRVLTSVAGDFGSPQPLATDALQAVACASVEFCAVADLDGVVRVGTPGRFGPPHQLAGPFDQPIALACPSDGVCIAAGPAGAITVLSDGRWHVIDSPGTPAVGSAQDEAISCPAGWSYFCAVAAGFDNIEVGGAPFT